MKKSVVKFILLAALFASSTAYSQVNLLFSGNLTIPNCTVNNNSTIQVEWDDVGIDIFAKANVAYMIKHERIILNCPYYHNMPKITLTAQQGGKDNYIRTSKYDEGLIISVRMGQWNDNNNLQLGRKITIPGSAITGTGADKILTLSFALARTRDIDDLRPGRFTASANLEVIYE